MIWRIEARSSSAPRLQQMTRSSAMIDARSYRISHVRRRLGVTQKFRAEPNLNMIPGHDSAELTRFLKAGLLTKGF
jgi:hypothetical protein